MSIPTSTDNYMIDRDRWHRDNQTLLERAEHASFTEPKQAFANSIGALLHAVPVGPPRLGALRPKIQIISAWLLRQPGDGRSSASRTRVERLSAGESGTSAMACISNEPATGTGASMSFQRIKPCKMTFGCVNGVRRHNVGTLWLISFLQEVQKLRNSSELS